MERAIPKSRCPVVIPACNEERRIASVVRLVRAQGFSPIVVDDGSRDRTSDAARRAGACVLRHAVNLGKGAAMKTGADFAFSRGARAIVFLDGDGQHSPDELPLFLERLVQGYDIVFGARKVVGRMPIERRAGRWLFRKVIEIFYGMRLHDPLCGYRALTKAAYAKVRWRNRGYDVESEMIARAGKAMLTHAEIPIETIYHDRYKGMTMGDGVRIMARLVWWRMTH